MQPWQESLRDTAKHATAWVVDMAASWVTEVYLRDFDEADAHSVPSALAMKALFGNVSGHTLTIVSQDKTLAKAPPCRDAISHILYVPGDYSAAIIDGFQHLRYRSSYGPRLAGQEMHSLSVAIRIFLALANDHQPVACPESHGQATLPDKALLMGFKPAVRKQVASWSPQLRAIHARTPLWPYDPSHNNALARCLKRGGARTTASLNYNADWSQPSRFEIGIALLRDHPVIDEVLAISALPNGVGGGATPYTAP